MARKFLYTVIILTWSISCSFSQGIRGKIVDSNGEPVPYAAIFIKELTRGTTCNSLGSFSLPLPQGDYTIFFRSLGYSEVTRNIELEGSFIDLRITLPPQTYMIPEVRVSASGEDPAYWIMRKAIGLANYHLHEVASYSAEIYIKGAAFIERLPRAIARRIEVNDIQMKEDESYMMESLNEVRFKAPDKYEMRVLASQNTIPGYSDNVNPMDYINASLYQPEIESIVSPLARNAFTYYRFSFEGTFLEGTYVVNKIRVTPKRKSQQLCEGFLYIVEDLWCLHSSDISVNTIAGTLRLKQLYANVMVDAWLPVNHQISVDVEIAGIKGDITYVSSLEYSDVTLNPNLPETYFTSTVSPDEEQEELREEEISREEEKIRALLQKEELTNRDVSRLSRLMEKEAQKAGPGTEREDLNQTGTTFSVAEDAVKNDSVYWNRIRPIPLTPVEQMTLRERDSIMGLQRQVIQSDSVQGAPGKRNSFRNLVRGRTYTALRGWLQFEHGGLLDPDMLGYNTVDGLYYGQDLRLNWRLDTMFTFRSRLLAGYAFMRHAPRITWNTDLLYAPLARGKVAIYLNYTSSDMNGSTGIPGATNMVYTLFLRENHLKMYERADATLFNRIDIANGLVLTATLTVGQRRRLNNSTDFSLFFRDRKTFTPNLPPSMVQDDPALADHSKLEATLQLDFTPWQPYMVRSYRKDLVQSNWPTFTALYRQAFPVEAPGWSDFRSLELKINHHLEVGLLSTLEWTFESGFYLDAASLHYSDFKHFKSSPLLVDMADFDHALMFLDYYEAGTSDRWAAADVKFTSSYLLFKFLPWLSEMLWKESLRLSYLWTPAVPHYIQAGYTLNELFFLADLGIFVAFREGTYNGFGARINFRF